MGKPRLTQEQVLKRFRAAHGDKYDYSRVQYQSGKIPVEIICPKHGVFSQVPTSHWKGFECNKCGNEKIAASKAFTVVQFVNQAEKKHDDRYDYSEVIYKNAHTLVTIICPKHGRFRQTPDGHMYSEGCNTCGYEKRANSLRKRAAKRVISGFRIVHGDRYDYSLVEYTDKVTPVTIICPEHGPYQQVPYAHKSGRGCYPCGLRVMASGKVNDKDDVIGRFIDAHGDRYDYSRVEYISLDEPVTIICREHGTFQQDPTNHIRGSGCPSCSVGGFNPNAPGKLYYLRVTTKNTLLYKIGITNRPTKDRVRQLRFPGTKIEILNVEKYENGADAYWLEQEFHKEFSPFQYSGPHVLKSGNTELFTKDVLEKDIGTLGLTNQTHHTQHDAPPVASDA